MTEQSQDNGQFVSKSTPIIKVIGCGNCGAKLIDMMLEKGIDRVEFSVLDTDKDFLENISCPKKSLIGRNIANGQGAGGAYRHGESRCRRRCATHSGACKKCKFGDCPCRNGGEEQEPELLLL